MSSTGDHKGRITTAPEAAGGEDRPPETGRHIPALPRAILERVRKHDPAALEEFFEHYFPTIYGLAYRFLGNVQQAEDVTQEVFLKLHRGAARLDPDRDSGPWVFTVTMNTCRSTHRSGAHRMETQAVMMNGSTDSRVELTDPGPNPAEVHERGERERAVQAALGELPESLREVVLLHDYQGLSHRKVAEVLELKPDAVRKRYSRALAELAALLRDRDA